MTLDGRKRTCACQFWFVSFDFSVCAAEAPQEPGQEFSTIPTIVTRTATDETEHSKSIARKRESKPDNIRAARERAAVANVRAAALA